VPLEAGDAEDTGIHRASSIRLVHDRALIVLSEVDGVAVTIGGDCGVSLAAVGHANDRHAGNLAVVWLDAHPDLNSPTSSPSGNFGGMVLRALLGDGAPGLVPANPLTASQVVLAGTRSFDQPEDAFIAEAGISTVGIEQLDTPDALVAAIAATGATSVYLHIDVDVLDPGELVGLGNPLPFGLPATQLVELIKAVKAQFEFGGATIAQFAPASAEDALEDLPTLLRIIGALAA